MTVIITHRHRDGSVERKFVPTVYGSEKSREYDISKAAHDIRQSLRDRKGWDKKKIFKHIAAIPVELREYVRRNDGEDAANDAKHLIRTADELGLNVRTGRGRI